MKHPLVEEARLTAHFIGHTNINFYKICHDGVEYRYGRCPDCGRCCDVWITPPVNYPFALANGPALDEACRK